MRRHSGVLRRITIFTGLLITSGLTLSYAQTKPQDTAKYRVLGWDKDNNQVGHIAIVDQKGAVEWEYAVPANSMHDIQLLPNGNILFHNGVTVSEVTPEKKIVWEYTSKPKEGYSGRVTVHSFERLPNGLTMIAESGNQRIIEVDKDGKIQHEIPLTVDKPSAGSDTRWVRSVPGGGYLVAHEFDNKIREYDRQGKVVWEYKPDLNGLPESDGLQGHGAKVFSAKRLPNGNTLIGAGNNNRLLEVDKSGKIVWSIESKDLPGIKLCWITSIDPLPNGDIIFGNSHAGPDNPQLIEVSRDKKVVWTFKNWTEFGNTLVAAKVLRNGK
jgi:hypothetical protein